MNFGHPKFQMNNYNVHISALQATNCKKLQPKHKNIIVLCLYYNKYRVSRPGVL